MAHFSLSHFSLSFSLSLSLSQVSHVLDFAPLLLICSCDTHGPAAAEKKEKQRASQGMAATMEVRWSCRLHRPSTSRTHPGRLNCSREPKARKDVFVSCLASHESNCCSSGICKWLHCPNVTVIGQTCRRVCSPCPHTGTPVVAGGAGLLAVCGTGSGKNITTVPVRMHTGRGRRDRDKGELVGLVSRERFAGYRHCSLCTNKHSWQLRIDYICLFIASIWFGVGVI